MKTLRKIKGLGYKTLALNVFCVKCYPSKSPPPVFPPPPLSGGVILPLLSLVEEELSPSLTLAYSFSTRTGLPSASRSSTISPTILYTPSSSHSTFFKSFFKSSEGRKRILKSTNCLIPASSESSVYTLSHVIRNVPRLGNSTLCPFNKKFLMD